MSVIGGKMFNFNFIKNSCDLCSHEAVCSMKESYKNFVRELGKKSKVENAPECVEIQVNCKYQDVDIRVKDW